MFGMGFVCLSVFLWELCWALSLSVCLFVGWVVFFGVVSVIWVHSDFFLCWCFFLHGLDYGTLLLNHKSGILITFLFAESIL